MTAMLWKEFRAALRIVRAAPLVAGFSVVAIAVGTASSALLFDLPGVLTDRPGGIPRPEQLVEFKRVSAKNPPSMWFSYPDYEAYSGLVSLEGLAAVAVRPATLMMNERPIRIACALVTANYFVVLDVGAVIGRTFDGTSDRQDVVVSHSFFVRHLGGLPDQIGRTLALNRGVFRIVGVLPADFRGTTSAMSPDVWVQVAAHEAIVSTPQSLRAVIGGSDLRLAKTYSWLGVVGRLAPAASIERAQAEVNTRRPDGRVEVSRLSTIPLQLRETVKQTVTLLMWFVGAIVAVAYLNALLLLLQRLLERRKDLAVRLALGAPRSAIAAQTGWEAALVLFTGTILGLGVLAWLRPGLAHFLPAMTFPPDVELSGGKWGAAIALLLATAGAVSVALLTYFRLATVARLAPSAVLGARDNLRQRVPVTWKVLVSLQVLASTLLVTWAAQSFLILRQTRAVELGFTPAGLLLAPIDADFSGLSPQARREFYDRLMATVREIPGVLDVAMADAVPLRPPRDILSVDPRPRTPIIFQTVSTIGRYFETLQIPVRRGRTFGELPGGDHLVLNEAAAQQTLKTLKREGDDPLSVVGTVIDGREIIGVVSDIRRDDLTPKPQPTEYLLASDATASRMSLFVRHAAGAADVVARLHQLAPTFPPGVYLETVRSADEHVATSLWRERFVSDLAVASAVVASLVALVGVFGIAARYAVAHRAEHALRLALGATPTSIVRRVVGKVFLIALPGLLVAVPAAIISSRALELARGAGALPAVASSAVVCLVFVGVAAYLPARRAASTDPLTALKAD